MNSEGGKRCRGDKKVWSGRKKAKEEGTNTLPNHIRDADDLKIERNLERHGSELRKLQVKVNELVSQCSSADADLSRSKADMEGIISTYVKMIDELEETKRDQVAGIEKSLDENVSSMDAKISEVRVVVDELKRSVNVNTFTSKTRDSFAILEGIGKDFQAAQDDLKQRMEGINQHFNRRISDLANVIRGDCGANQTIAKYMNREVIHRKMSHLLEYNRAVMEQKEQKVIEYQTRRDILEREKERELSGEGSGGDCTKVGSDENGDLGGEKGETVNKEKEGDIPIVSPFYSVGGGGKGLMKSVVERNAGEESEESSESDSD
eukprot:2826160-Rhodomonas_salina.2